MLANDIEQREIRKALFVVAQYGGRVDSSQNGRLSRGALRAAFDAQPRVSNGKDAIKGN